MLVELNDLRSYQDLSEWEDGFVENVWDQVVRAGNSTVGLSAKQVDKIQQLHERHFFNGRH
jgi:hypothetical protein